MKNNETSLIPDRLLRILRTSERPETHRFPPTEVFNEGWMLRLVLDAFQTLGIPDHPLSFHPNAAWYSEARLLSPFRPRMRGDALGEGFTHADAVVGHFKFRSDTLAGLRLAPNATQFVVIEAKMYSDLSSGTTRAKGCNQAARNVACMAEALMNCNIAPTEFLRLGFVVIAPAPGQRRPGLIDSALQPAAVANAIRERVAAYATSSRAEAVALEVWERDFVDPLLAHMAGADMLKLLTWDACIARIAEADPVAGEEVAAFYASCLSLGRLERLNVPELTGA